MNMQTLPLVPESAPFTAEQRLWLNGYIAGLVSDAGNAPAVSTLLKVRIPLIYASQSGNAEGLAEDFSEQLSGSGFDAPCLGAEDFGELDLASEKHLLIISSTWGEGDPPDNAIEFWNALQADDHPRLDGLKFSVLALGDSNYLEFCKQGKAFDDRLEELGAARIVPRVDCDTDFEEPAGAWFAAVLATLGDSAPRSLPQEPSSSKRKDSGYSKKNPFPAKLIENRRLNARGSSRDTRHFAFDLKGSDLSYEVGDVLGVYPKNNVVHVDEMIAALGFSPDDVVPTPDSGERPLRIALIENYDIHSISAKTISEWVSKTGSTTLREILESEDISVMADYLWGRELIDLIHEHPLSFGSPSEFVSLLRKLGARLYSISSSPMAHEDEVHLTVAKVTYHSHGRDREGVCSSYLSDRVGDEEAVPIFFQPAAHFKLPADTASNIIMCGPGTGIAPFRAFLEERDATRAPGGNWLFFGNPHESTDFLYQEELKDMQERGRLDRLDLAWSRDSDTKVYVQDLMKKNGEALWKWLDGGAHFYVCGDAKRMAKDVDAALHHIAAVHGGLGEGGAAEFIKQLKKEKRYQRDVY